MKIFSLENSNSLKCIKNDCLITSKFIIDINYKDFILKGECMNGHYFECKLNNFYFDGILKTINSVSFFL